MKLYAEFFKVEKMDDGTVRVSGVASSEAVDSQGEIVKSDAMRDALPDFMALGTGALRSMHQPIAAGLVTKAEVRDDGKTYIEAEVVDPVEALKVEKGVYKGFSIGGKVTKREGKTIEKIKLGEISLVDRGANPEALLSLMKVDDAEGPFADPKNKKYPIDDEEHIRAAWSYINKEKNADEYSASELKAVKDKIIAAWKEHIDKDGPPSAAKKADGTNGLEKGMYSVSQFAEVLQGLAYMAAGAEDEADWEGDDSKVPAQLKAWLALGIEVFKEMAAEETAELLAALKQPAVELPEPTVIENSAKIIDLAKAGARHSAKDKEHLQAIHDHSAAMGADCPGNEEHGEEAEKLAKADALAKVDALEKSLADATKRIAELEAQPVAPKGATADLPGVTLTKSEDAGAGDQREAALKKAAESGDPLEMTKFLLKYGGKAIA